MNEGRLEGTLERISAPNGTAPPARPRERAPWPARLRARQPRCTGSGRQTRAGLASSAPTAPPTWSSCPAPYERSTRWPGAAPSGCGADARAVHERPWRADRQPGLQKCAPGCGDLPVWLAGRCGREPGRPDVSRTRACTRPTRSRRCRRINNALLRADQITAEGEEVPDWLVPIVADAEAGFGGPLNASSS